MIGFKKVTIVYRSGFREDYNFNGFVVCFHDYHIQIYTKSYRRLICDIALDKVSSIEVN